MAANTKRKAKVKKTVFEGNVYIQATFNNTIVTITDLNGNGKWDTGDYDLDLQAEQVYYCPERIECKAKWIFQRDWTPDATPLQNQKRAEITKQKPDKEKKIRQQNATRARKLGIPSAFPRCENVKSLTCIALLLLVSSMSSSIIFIIIIWCIVLYSFE